MTGTAIDLNRAYRCMTLDVITYLCFGKSVDAIQEPGFRAPIIQAMDASMPVFVRFKHSETYKNLILKCPPSISRVISPATAGLVDLQEILGRQIADLTSNPGHLEHLPHDMTIYHQLLSPEAHKAGTVPTPGSLYEETQALMFGGADTTGNALMVGTFHLLRRPEASTALKEELQKAWPELNSRPDHGELQGLPYLDAVIKESLRLSCGVVSGLLRVVPPGGASIVDQHVPGGISAQTVFEAGPF